MDEDVGDVGVEVFGDGKVDDGVLDSGDELVVDRDEGGVGDVGVEMIGEWEIGDEGSVLVGTGMVGGGIKGGGVGFGLVGGLTVGEGGRLLERKSSIEMGLVKVACGSRDGKR